ncbi:hypothetical protein [Spirosoma oryzicola]|uniref:hypothetical protein n=1 Tax=Spirosoma oryzicola TaxID=2898794 RepID=UPI001E64311C|nr:hypothetical protein [Spirosoma oryzicola]UHG93232.1 hypothetical protein LQ777_10105 [Spirosoma oryzicola]
MIQDTIDNINGLIKRAIPSPEIQVEGIVVLVHDQQENAVTVKLGDTETRFSLDSKLVFQSLHLVDGYIPRDQDTFGSFTDTVYDVRFVLVGVSKKRSNINVALNALRETSYIKIDGVENDTLSVLTRYFKVKADQNKNYDPALFAFAIRYHIEGVADEDFTEVFAID